MDFIKLWFLGTVGALLGRFIWKRWHHRKS